MSLEYCKVIYCISILLFIFEGRLQDDDIQEMDIKRFQQEVSSSGGLMQLATCRRGFMKITTVLRSDLN